MTLDLDWGLHALQVLQVLDLIIEAEEFRFRSGVFCLGHGQLTRFCACMTQLPQLRRVQFLMHNLLLYTKGKLAVDQPDVSCSLNKKHIGRLESLFDQQPALFLYILELCMTLTSPGSGCKCLLNNIR